MAIVVSAMLVPSMANMAAYCCEVSPFPSEAWIAALIQALAPVPPADAQKAAAAVCSAVRAEVFPPIAVTSASAVANSVLPIAGGASGRNELPLSIVHVLTEPHHG